MSGERPSNNDYTGELAMWVREPSLFLECIQREGILIAVYSPFGV